eukprot:9302835-Pyramimonas_sp.AAC.1
MGRPPDHKRRGHRRPMVEIVHSFQRALAVRIFSQTRANSERSSGAFGVEHFVEDNGCFSLGSSQKGSAHHADRSEPAPEGSRRKAMRNLLQSIKSGFPPQHWRIFT